MEQQHQQKQKHRESQALLLTDLYELTMIGAYRASGMREQAVFELFVRTLPSARGFLLAAGLEQALDFLEGLHFDEADLRDLERMGDGKITPHLIDTLRDLHFTGDVDAVPEGTVVFENEPLVRVVAPIAEAQLIETRLINLIHLQTLIASTAARSVLAAPNKVLVDFGVRRAHGFEAGLLAARAAYIAGFDGTSTVLAGIRFGIPLYGTMAHSFIEAHDSELDAFRNFARANPANAIFLLDTYDTENAARMVVMLAQREGIRPQGVRIDSGDLGEHARRVRKILDEGGLRDCAIFASGGLDDLALRDLVGPRSSNGNGGHAGPTAASAADEAAAAGAAPIDGFGIGTRLDTAADAPYLDCAYKLEEYGGRARLKLSEGKRSWPGRKQVYRQYDANHQMTGDLITLLSSDGKEDREHEGTRLLIPVMRGGCRVHFEHEESLAAIRRRAAEQLRSLPRHLRALDVAPRYPVRMAPELEMLAAKLEAST